LFIYEIPLRKINDKRKLKTATAIVWKEFNIGPIKRRKETGGKIDILIKFENPEYGIVIENKIDARDQDSQLARYYNYLIGEYPKKNFTILYLTKFGSKPSEKARGVTINSKNVYWNCISYMKDIKTWLSISMKKAINNLPVHETIKQYINVIDIITDKDLDMKDNKSVIKQLYSGNLFETASEFVSIWEQRQNLIAEIIADKIRRVCKGWIKMEDSSYEKTIYKLINREENIYLFFEPETLTIGFYGKKTLKGKKQVLKQILDELSFDCYDSNYDKSIIEDPWAYTVVNFDEEQIPTKKTIDNIYYNDISKALMTLERKYKNYKKCLNM
jgi:hypothetical protein